MIEPDDIDWAAYERLTEVSAKVMPASAYLDQLDQQFEQRPWDARRPRMSSTKLGGCIDFRPAEVTVWAGYNGHRKSLVVGQMVLDLCQQGERCLVLSMEMLPVVTLARMMRQAWGANAPNRRWREVFTQWSDGRLWLFDHLGRLSPAKCLAVLRHFADQLRGTHVVIDSMMMVCNSEESLDEQKQLVTDLVRVAQETEMHLHLVAHARKPQGDESKLPAKYEIRGSSAISDQVHNVIMVWANREKKAVIEQYGAMTDEKWLEQPDAVLCVDKQRNGAFEGKLKLWWDESSYRFTNSRMSPIEPYVLDGAAQEYS
jgi:twinkle protein